MIYANSVFTYAVNDLHEQVYHVQYSRIHAVIEYKLNYIVSNARITCVQYLEYLKVTDVNITLHGGLHD